MKGKFPHKGMHLHIVTCSTPGFEILFSMATAGGQAFNNKLWLKNLPFH